MANSPSLALILAEKGEERERFEASLHNKYTDTTRPPRNSECKMYANNVKNSKTSKGNRGECGEQSTSKQRNKKTKKAAEKW